MRQVVLDTETTGLNPADGHRIIEIGCVEVIGRRLTGNNYHQYLQPDREIDQGAIEVHGITNEFLADKPRFSDIADDFLEFVRDAELIIHNAPFDVGFINNELRKMQSENIPVPVKVIEDCCGVLDTLAMARKMHTGQKNDLNSLCQRYSIDNSQRTLHGALLDAEILADVYLIMTGGQTGFFEDSPGTESQADASAIRRFDGDRPAIRIIKASADELESHEEWLKLLDRETNGQCLWRKIDQN